MANELNDFRIIGAKPNNADLVILPSDYTAYNRLSYISSPSRDNQFALNSESITHKYIPTIEIEIPLMSEEDYSYLCKKINTPSFAVHYFDIELGQAVDRTVYCSERDFEKIYNKGSKALGTLKVKITLVSIFGYDSYSDLKTASYSRESTKYKMTARIYFSKPDQFSITGIYPVNEVSYDSSFKGGTNLSEIKQIRLGSHIFLLGTSLTGGDTFGNNYNGMIMISSKSSTDVSASNDYEFSVKPEIKITASGNGQAFIRFDSRTNEYATRMTIAKSDGTSEDISSSDNLVEIPLLDGENTLYINAWNKPNRWARITTIADSFVIDYSTDDYLKSVSFDMKATDSAGKADYGFSLSNAEIVIYDKENIIKELAEDKYVNATTKVEVYLGTQSSLISDSNKICFYRISKYDYLDSSYDRNIKITLIDVFDSLNNYKSYDKTSDTLKWSYGYSLFDLLQSMVSKATNNEGNLVNGSKPSAANSTMGIKIMDYSPTVFQFVDSFGKLFMSYLYSDGLGNILILENE
jgi:hypothetical protein